MSTAKPDWKAKQPQDVAWITEHTRDLDGFFGASSIERLATEVAITEQTRRFKSLRQARKPVPAGGRGGGVQIGGSQESILIPRSVLMTNNNLCGVVTESSHRGYK